MTIEIRQMVIRAVVDRKPEPTLAVEPPRPGAFFGTSYAASAPAPAVQQDALVDAVVRQVLRKLERSRER